MYMTFTDFTKDSKSLILEMPHIMLDGGKKIVDLELEVHSKMKPNEFVSYIEDWVDRKTN